MRLFFQDEARFGLHLPRYRRVTAPGVQPRQPVAPLYEYYWLYGAVEPTTGETPGNASSRRRLLWRFLAEMSRAYAETLNVLVLDNAPAHVAAHVRVPENVVLLYLPPYCPELNPVERLWLEVRRRINVFDAAVRSTLVGLREHVAEIVRGLLSEQIASITGHRYILNSLPLCTDLSKN